MTGRLRVTGKNLLKALGKAAMERDPLFGAGDEEVVAHGDAKDLPRLDEAAGEGPVLAGR